MLNNKKILITGGTGTFGRRLVETVLRDYPHVKKVIVFSRNEQNQLDMQDQFPETKYPAIRYFIGDIRDAERLKRACEEVDIIIHAAAIRNVNTATYNPDECIKTNIIGTQNVINAALACNVHDVISLSSDKACAPTTLYGASKLTSDKLVCAANNLSGVKDIRFSVVRFSDILGGPGSVYPIWKQAIEMNKSELLVTDCRMTRFNISMPEAIQTVLYALAHHVGGEIFVPKCMSYTIVDLAKAMAPDLALKEIGLRPNEKLHEELITAADARDTIDLGHYYAILPALAFNHTREQILSRHNAGFVDADFSYRSDNNSGWETVDSLRSKIKRYIDHNFSL